MIELPEATHLAQQLTAELHGRTIAFVERGNAPMKFAFYTAEPEEYRARMEGQTIGVTTAHGNRMLVSIGADQVLALGEGGERIFFHKDASTLPAKRQFLMQFTDGSYLTVNIQMWGAVQLYHVAELPAAPYMYLNKLSPLAAEFTREYFGSLFTEIPSDDSRSIKYFIISVPGILGVGNGYLHDILFRARVHPRRKAVQLTAAGIHALYDGIRTTLQEAVEQNGREDELDLYGNPGGYKRILSSKTAGQPCPNCSEKIEKIQFLGGACYFCPRCQE